MQHLSVPAAVPSSPVAWQLTAPEVRSLQACTCLHSGAVAVPGAGALD